MADAKISALTALTGANVATGDLVAVVDISDTTMAASGTDHKMTFAEFILGIAARGSGSAGAGAKAFFDDGTFKAIDTSALTGLSGAIYITRQIAK